MTNICTALASIVNEKSKLSINARGYLQGSVDLQAISTAISVINDELEKYRCAMVDGINSENRNIDLPLFYEFKNLMSSCFDLAIKESAVGLDRLNEYISTLKLRMQSFVDDIRLSGPLMLNKQININNVLAKFIAFVLGDYCTMYNKKEQELSIYDSYYSKEGDDTKHQITIIDMSLLPFQVLETVTGLIGRMILDFLSRFEKDKRGSIPVVIVLEEAQNYIPEKNIKDRESISRRVFERIAREGRKYGLSLLVSSQRPSELSKTVLSQCNSFIVHRIQNPDDQIYIRKLVSSANSEILSQLPTLPQQHVILMGDCVKTPVVAKMKTANPKPNSNNPKFISNWLKDKTIEYTEIEERWLEE